MSGMLRWTPEQLAAHQARKPAPSPATKADPMARFHALGRLAKDVMNKTERAYADVLEQQRQRGEIIDWKFHPMNVRLAKNTFYEVDFLVLAADMRVEIHETKGGYTTEKGGMKIKLCAEALPWFRFIKATKLPAKLGGGWKREDF
ncbi:hypothetical protein [Cupriavidus oxalaticus]|uniref:DUF1064 domain-containing protein n=1 Tax=Cupriavidus oxalaticus TaxID=96344 RepID=A0A976GBU1_9BURK|nr:hypothetical protein [Cupriavidus oxalaticus]QRQ86270.1 hypothetical protein JTE91_23975 [Cupriavidus oxalaticus]QRQ95403.1 hypothetical protein JTE92_18285 [Cupriavidus oxalaticus]WQD84059.1 hypothetical protein U0036_05990 [Cupriavidus oxalaticus]SPC17373.1 conserved hypothetical protein [Cupriavidus oxalaticus]